MTRILVMRKQISRELETNAQKHANIHHLFIFIFFPLADIFKRIALIAITIITIYVFIYVCPKR